MHINFVRMIIKAGGNVNYINITDENSCGELYYAVMHGWTEIVKLLIKAGVNVNAVNNYNSTPLHMAMVDGTYGHCKATY